MKGLPWYCDLKPVIALQILDYDSSRVRESTATGVADSLVHRTEGHPMVEGQFFKHYLLQDKQSGQVIDHLQMIQVELPRGRKMLESKPDHKTFKSIDWWLELFCFSEEYTPDRVLSLKAGGVDIPAFFDCALARLDKSVWSPQMNREYDLDLTDRAAYATVLAVERSEGVTEGRREGRKEVAHELKKMKMPVEQIAAATGLSTAEVDDITVDD